MSCALPLSLHIGKWTRCPLPLFCAARSGGALAQNVNYAMKSSYPLNGPWQAETVIGQ